MASVYEEDSMSDAKDKKDDAPSPKGKKNMLVIIIVAVLAIGGGAGGTWFFMQDKKAGAEEEAEPEEEKPAVFTDLDVFTVNLQPEEDNQYLQVGLTVKSRESAVIETLKKQMPEVRNRILLLLSSKLASQISTMDGKQKLSSEITDEIKQSLDSEKLQDDILGVLFTSFVIQ